MSSEVRHPPGLVIFNTRLVVPERVSVIPTTARELAVQLIEDTPASTAAILYQMAMVVEGHNDNGNSWADQCERIAACLSMEEVASVQHVLEILESQLMSRMSDLLPAAEQAAGAKP